MGLFKRKSQEIRADTQVTYDDALLSALLGGTAITKESALQIPTVSSAISSIAAIIASTPIKLYKESEGQTSEVVGDVRTRLLNDDTGDTLNANQFWKAITEDYYLGKGGYAYNNKEKGGFKSLHFVDEKYIAIQKNVDPIFKDYDILVNGIYYKPYDFLKILRNTKDGASGIGIVAELNKILEVAYETLIFEGNLVKKGGNKKGFLKADRELTASIMDALKAAFNNLYSNADSEKVVVLNKGIDFKESSSTSVELQLNENKLTNSLDIGKLFHTCNGILNGNATEAEIQSFAKIAVIPYMKTIECALNKDYLLEKEKGSFYFAFDTKELLKGSLKERFEAYEKAVKNGFMTRNEVRFTEDLPEIEGMNVISMSLADVIYDIDNKTYFVPNTKQITSTISGLTTDTSKGDE